MAQFSTIVCWLLGASHSNQSPEQLLPCLKGLRPFQARPASMLVGKKVMCLGKKGAEFGARALERRARFAPVRGCRSNELMRQSNRTHFSPSAC